MSAPVLKSIPSVTRITSKLIRILGCNPGPMTLQGTNTYLIGNGKSRILVDAGDAHMADYVETLKNVLSEECATINNIIVTHWHHDHIGGVGDILEALNYSPEGCRVWKYPRSDAVDQYDEIPRNIELQKLAHGQEFSVDGADLKVVHTPGHTTDHVVLLMKENNALFSGDCILGEGTAVFEDLHDYMKSLKVILDEKPSVIYPGHGSIIDNPISKIEYYINHRNQRETQILDVLRAEADQWKSVMDIVAVIYKETPEYLWPAAARNVSQHLQKLLKENAIISCTDEADQTTWRIK